MPSYQLIDEGPQGPDGRLIMAKPYEGGPVGQPRANAHPDGWNTPPRDAKKADADQFPRTKGVADGYGLGKTNEQRAQDARDRAK